MSDLLRSTVPLGVTTPWGTYSIRQPRTGEALAILTALQAEDYETFYSVLVDWLPCRLHSELRSEVCPDELAANTVLDLIQSGATPPDDDEDPEEDSDSNSGSSWTDVDWGAHIADYRACYGGLSLAQVLDEPWHGFLNQLSKVDRIEARQQLRRLQTEGLPHIKSDRERDKALQDLQRRAGYSKQEEKPQSYEEQVAKLDALFASA